MWDSNWVGRNWEAGTFDGRNPLPKGEGSITSRKPLCAPKSYSLTFCIGPPRFRISDLALMIHEVDIEPRIPKAKKGERVAAGIIGVAALARVEPLHRNGRLDLGKVVRE